MRAIAKTLFSPLPEDLTLREDFGRVTTADYRTFEAQCSAGVFPLWVAFDNPQIFKWFSIYVGQDATRTETWNAFYENVLTNVISYTLPVIVLNNSTPKEAVCTVFEKVNTGGVQLSVFELLTATFAGDKNHPDFRLRDDWAERKIRLEEKPVLRSLENTEFLQAVTLLASWKRRQAVGTADKTRVPAITCKRKDILRLGLDEYLRCAPEVENALLWAAGFLGQEHVFAGRDLPYHTQLVPLAAIRAVLGGDADKHSVHKKLRQWFWCGVLGELYGGSTETRFARDLEQVVEWVKGPGAAVEPATVAEANFQASRLLTLRTRNSAAYKGVYALLMRDGCMDWAYRQQLDMANFLDLNVDIHHIFPKTWCDKNGIDPERRESVVNKTALSAPTNRVIGGSSPEVYMQRIESKSGLSGRELDEIVQLIR